ncbi:MAG: hypothetical protein JWO58_466 [Chitinophagaceae bacterium]|nr:hypothetical protein [Chitinophagaceae bacterium]
MKKLFTTLFGLALAGYAAAQPGLVISEFLAKPSGSESPYEYVELLATQSINFATTPYTVVVCTNGTATANGWKEGGAISYAFQISTGTVTAGQVIYVGGSSMAPLSNGGTSFRSINTSTTNGDSFGTKNTDGIFGNGGSNADGVAVFKVAASSLSGSTVPVDALFFGDDYGSAYKSSGSGYQLPVNDKYNGGKLLKTSYLGPDPGAGDLIRATGTFNTSTNTWTTARSWSTTSTATYNTTSVTLAGTTNQAPVVSLTAPANGATYTAPATVSLTATASDADGTISKVEFYNGTTLLSSDASSPYSYSWTSVAAGTYNITAKAYDNSSATTTSSVSTITVNAVNNQLPTVTLTAPANGSTYTAPATVSITATASDADGTISKVEFYNGTTLLSTDTSSPYSYSWTNVAAGTYSITAKAYDNLSGTATSTVSSITVNPGANQAPTVTLTAPANGAVFTAPATVSITATASDADGTISKVEFYNGTTLLSTDTSSPYSYSWTSVAVGTYSITAKAYDNLSATATSAASAITVNAANQKPTIAFLSSASTFVNESSGVISSVKGDATDPVSVSGLDITVTDENLAALTFTMTSSSSSVVAATSFSVVGTGNNRKFIITPSGVGYTNITLNVTDNGGLSAATKISFSLAVSADFTTTTISDAYHTGFADASAAIVVDDNYMFVADDETNLINLYDRHHSGLPVYSFDPTSHLGLTDDLEVDLEAAFVSATNPNRIYWFSSQGNSKKGNVKPDRDRVFATDIVGTGANATLSFVGYYKGLRSKIMSWGDANGLGLTAAGADGEIPKEINGYNIEGAVMGPDNTTAYIGFRAPYVPAGTQNKALICPLLNFETWFNAGAPSGSPSFAAPIEISLGVRGIRDIEKNASNQYIIVAGSFDATSNFALYSWNGQAATAPVLLGADLTGLSPEAIAVVPATLTGTVQLHLISDDGSTVYYNDAIEAKDLTQANYKKFISSYVSVNMNGSARFDASSSTSNTSAVNLYPNPATSAVTLDFPTDMPVPVLFNIYNAEGMVVKQIIADGTSHSVVLNLNDLKPAMYTIKAEGMDAMKVLKK